MRFTRKCTQEDAIHGSHIDVTAIIKSPNIYPTAQIAIQFYCSGEATIPNGSQNQSFNDNKQGRQSQHNISQNEGHHILQQQPTSSSLPPSNVPLSLQSEYTRDIIADTGYTYIQLAKFLLSFLYYIILKPLLFGYKKVQFLDSTFVDYLNVSKINDTIKDNVAKVNNEEHWNSTKDTKCSESLFGTFLNCKWFQPLTREIPQKNSIVDTTQMVCPNAIFSAPKNTIVLRVWLRTMFLSLSFVSVECEHKIYNGKLILKNATNSVRNFVVKIWMSLVKNYCCKFRSCSYNTFLSASFYLKHVFDLANVRKLKNGIDSCIKTKHFRNFFANFKCKFKLRRNAPVCSDIRTKVYNEWRKNVELSREDIVGISKNFVYNSRQLSYLHTNSTYFPGKRNYSRQSTGFSISFVNILLLLVILACMPHIVTSFHHNIKYSMNVVKTKYGSLRGIIVRSNPTVEAFLGVPYASPPVGSLRFMPPVTPSTWKTTRLADRFSAVCPQATPVPPSGPEALLEVPRGRLAQLRRLLPLLANQSEDCLYLNLYVPRVSPAPSALQTTFPGNFGSRLGTGTIDEMLIDQKYQHEKYPNQQKLLPVIVYIHGESYEWNSGNPYDGSVLAAHGHIIVVTINFRLGILGFLKTGGKGSAQGNFGLMDLVAGLHWLRENLPAFGGDPNNITLMGHGTGSALANILIVSPVANDLIHRAILLSGSALSPWAIQKDPLFVKRRVAEQTGCHGDMLEDDLAPCLRTKPISELLAVKIDSPRFLPGFAPFIDGTVIVNPSTEASGPLILPAGSAIASTSGIELADFPTRELIFGLTTIESYLDLSAQDLEFGFNETRRDRILRTFVRNVYHYHLNEIYAALKNEYTDWERSVRNPLGPRDASLEFLSDGHTAAPLIRLGYMHSLRGGKSYFLHFKHQSGERDFPQRSGSVHGEDIPFSLGLPISALFPYNYTREDIKISKMLIQYLSNFAQTGNPNNAPTATQIDISRVGNSNAGLMESMSLTSSLTSASSSSTILSPVKEATETSPSSSSGPSSIVKHVNDQYIKQLSSTSALKSSITSASSSQYSLMPSPSMFLSTSGSGLSTFQVDSSFRTSVKTKPKRRAIAAFRVKRKTVKNSLRKFSHNNKMSQRKRYPVQPNDSSLEESYYVAADQGGDQARIKHLIDSKEASEEDDDEINENNDEDDDDDINEEDKFVDKDEQDVTRSRIEFQTNEAVEKYDRFDDASKTTTTAIQLPFWDTYDAINQLYLELGNKVDIRNHYRGHKLSMWLSLIPQLHSPEDLTELPVRHHHFLEDNARFYDGIIRPQIVQRPTFPKVNIHQPFKPRTTAPTVLKSDPVVKLVAISASTTECPPNTTVVPTIAATRPQGHHQNGTSTANVIVGHATNKQGGNNLLRRLATTQYQSYSTALMVTIAVGCFLLILNILIFAGIYYQREKRANDAKKKEELKEAERCTSPSSEKLGGRNKGCRKSSLQSVTGFNMNTNFGEYSCYDEKLQCKEGHLLADICSVELPLKEFNCSSSPALSTSSNMKRPLTSHSSGGLQKFTQSFNKPPPTPLKRQPSDRIDEQIENLVTYQQYHQQIQQGKSGTSSTTNTSAEQCNQSTQSEQPTVQDVGTSIDEGAVSWNSRKDNLVSVEYKSKTTSLGIPEEAPPPPRSNAPYQGGILRQPGPPTTPGSNKKRVQIQEISV